MNFPYPLQQNAKVENDWCETRSNSLLPLQIPKATEKTLSVRGSQWG